MTQPRSRYQFWGDRKLQLVGRTGIPVGPSALLYKMLRSSSSGTGMNVDGSTATKWFGYTVPAGKVAYLDQLNIHIEDTTIEPDRFGGILSSDITNGLAAQIWDSNTTSQLLDLTDGHPINMNAEWAILAGQPAIIAEATAPGSKDDALYVNWELGHAGGILELTSGQAIRLGVRDDLSGLSEFHAMVHGLVLSSTGW